MGCAFYAAAASGVGALTVVGALLAAGAALAATLAHVYSLWLVLSRATARSSDARERHCRDGRLLCHDSTSQSVRRITVSWVTIRVRNPSGAVSCPQDR